MALGDPPGRAALDFFRSAADAASLEQLIDSFAVVAAAAGFSRASCVHIATPGEPIAPKALFGWNIADGSAHHLEAGLSRDDPTIQAAFTSLSAFTWSETETRSVDRRPQGADTRRSASAAVGGLVVPIHGPSGEVMAVILVSEHQSDFDPQTRMNMQLAATLFANRGLTLNEIEGEPDASADITRHESQCAYWASEGHNDWEIGRILGLAEDTVTFYMNRLKAKLGVADRDQIPPTVWRNFDPHDG